MLVPFNGSVSLGITGSMTVLSNVFKQISPMDMNILETLLDWSLLLLLISAI